MLYSVRRDGRMIAWEWHGGSVTDANRLYFGDCLDVMREFIPDESVDLICTDPPFNSKRLYNAFIGGAQFVAFDDTWQWYEAVGDFHEVAQQPAYRGLMEGLRMMLGEGPQLAYLSYMANRLLECRRVLKPTGSIYLHCDPAMSHYLKTVLDGLWGREGTFGTKSFGAITQAEHRADIFRASTMWFCCMGRIADRLCITPFAVYRTGTSMPTTNPATSKPKTATILTAR